jgi:hypothetical protein
MTWRKLVVASAPGRCAKLGYDGRGLASGAPCPERGAGGLGVGRLRASVTPCLRVKTQQKASRNAILASQPNKPPYGNSAGRGDEDPCELALLVSSLDTAL